MYHTNASGKVVYKTRLLTNSWSNAINDVHRKKNEKWEQM